MEQTSSRQQLGAHGEEVAVATLTAAGLTVIARNWRCRWGELDVVAVEEDAGGGRSALVFCEVKTRRGTGYGTPAEAITHAKLSRLRRLSAEWISTEWATTEWAGTGRRRPDTIRIDVVGVLLRPGRPVEVTHLRGVG